MRRGGLSELLGNLLVSEVLLYKVGYELAAVIVADVKPLGQSVVFKDRVKQCHHVALPDVPLDDLAHVPAAENVQHGQHLGVSPPTLDVNVLNVKLKVGEFLLRLRHQVFHPLALDRVKRLSVED